MDDKLKKLILLMEIKNEEKFSSFTESIKQLDKQGFELMSDIKLLFDEISKVESSVDDTELKSQIESLKESITDIQLQKGDKGEDGKDGKNGLNGKDGKDGRDGIDGIDGLNGKDGEKGDNGSPDTAEDIVKKINTLENVIERKTIKGLDTVIDKPELDRAIDILDRRTQYLINKTTVAPSATTWASITGTQTDVNVGGFTNDIGYLTSASLSGYVPNTRTLTINGTALDLSADRSWTIATGISSLNGLTGATQTFATGTAGTDFGISSSGTIHTFNLPTASASNRGALSSTDWTTFNNKFTLPSLTSGSVLFSNGTTIAQDNTNFFWDDTNNRLGLGTATPAYKLEINAGAVSGIVQQITTSTSDSFLRVSSSSRYVKIGADNLYGARFDTNAGGFAMPDAGDIVPTSNGVVTNLTTNLGRSGVAFGNIFGNLANFAGSGTNYFAGNIGIGQTAPTAYLHIKAGTATASTAPLKFTTGTLNTTAEAGTIEYLSPNFYFTPVAGERITFGMGAATNNMVIGRNAGVNLTSGVQHTFYGVSAGGTNVNSNYSTCIGFFAGNTTYGNTSYNTFVGWQAGASSFQFAQSKTGIGANAFVYGAEGIAIGATAQTGGGTGIISIGAGITANTTAAAGDHNISIGYQSTTSVLTGADNIAIGYKSGNIMTSGAFNVLMGYRAGDALTTGSNNIIIGKDIDAQGATTSDQLSIQNAIFGTGNSGTGTTASTGKIGIFAPAPNSSLQVTGSMSNSYVAKTANYTLTDQDYTVDCTANSFTVTLPTAVGITGRVYVIKNTGTATTITVATTSSQTIDGITPPTITTLTPLRVQSNGANWITI